MHKPSFIVFLGILLLASILRFYQLGNIPRGMSWDEVAIGYNGYGIATVRRDEWLNRLPITFKSFGDFKAPLAIYINALFTLVLGLTPFAVRLPMAIAGVVTVGASYRIAKKLGWSEHASLATMVFVALSPINIHYSRIAFESGIAVSLVSLAVLSFLHAGDGVRQRIFYLFSGFFFSLSLYAYHSTKLSIPFLLFLLLWFRFKQIKKDFLIILLAVFVSGIVMLPLLKESFFGMAGERFYMTSAVATRERLKPLGEIFSIVTTNLFAHLDPQFLLFGKTDTLRHGNGVFGILTPLEAIAFVIGSFALFRSTRDVRKTGIFLVGAIFIMLLPAILSVGVPHSNRAHGIVPWMQIIAGFGVGQLFLLFRRKKLLLGVVGVLLVVQTVYLYSTYLKIYSSNPEALSSFQYGSLEAAMLAKKYEAGSSKVVMTDSFGQPYIYVLFAKRLTPMQWQQGALANYTFRIIDWEREKNEKGATIVGTAEEIPAGAKEIVEEFSDESGRVILRVARIPE